MGACSCEAAVPWSNGKDAWLITRKRWFNSIRDYFDQAALEKAGGTEQDFPPPAVLSGVPTDQAPRDGLPGHRPGSRPERSTACLTVSQFPETARRLPPSAHSPAARRGGCPIRPAMRIGPTAPRTAASQVGAAGGGVRTPPHHQGSCGPAATPRTRCETHVPRSSSSCLTRETTYAGRTRAIRHPADGCTRRPVPRNPFARQHRVFAAGGQPDSASGRRPRLTPARHAHG